MKTGSLQDIMNDMARRLDVIRTDDDSYGINDGSVSEMGAYAAVDPVMADLYRQYLNARKRHKTLTNQNGDDDALAAVAGEQAESLDSALQTRLIELRGDKKLSARVETIMTRSLHKTEENEKETVREMVRKKFEGMDLRKLAEKARRERDDDLLVWLLLLLQITARQNVPLRQSFRFAGIDHTARAASY